MKLYVSCSVWGRRKRPDGVASLVLLDFDLKEEVARYDCGLAPGATRGFAGLTYDGDHLYAVRPVGGEHDEILRCDRASLAPVRRVPLAGCYDVHQIDYFDGLLWLANTNRHEIVVLDPRNEQVVGRHVLLPGVPEERVLTESRPKDGGDHRRRPHFNSLVVSDGLVQAGLFGTDSGNFLGSQLIAVRWGRGAGAAVEFHSPEPLPVNGFRYPHNVHRRPDGSVLGCSSAEGELRHGDRVLKLDGWPRGVAATRTDFYVGISSSSYGLSTSAARNQNPESPAAVVRIDRARMTVEDWYEFERPGQIYEVRLAEGCDLGMSANMHLDAPAGLRDAA